MRNCPKGIFNGNLPELETPICGLDNTGQSYYTLALQALCNIEFLA